MTTKRVSEMTEDEIRAMAGAADPEDVKARIYIDSDGDGIRELFDHKVTALTLGDLREAVGEAAHLADDLPLIVYYTEKPGGETVDEQVVISIAPWNGAEGEDAPPDCFSINCEFPSGRYYR